MTKAVAVYGTPDNTYQFALSRDGSVYHRTYKRHTRFGHKWNEWNVTDFPTIIANGFNDFKRIDKEVKVVLPRANSN